MLAIGSGCVRKFNKAGRLFVFCNDRGGYYWNNWGEITLTIDKEAG